jgi:diguanylate cyclase (GGDEF)-like protein
MEKYTLKNAKVLVVDDEVETLNLISDYLTEKGMNVVTADNGDHALHRFTEEYFHIVILDIYLPDINGIELLKKMKEEHSKVFVIMITGYGTIHDAVECMKLGAADFITKPILLDHLHITISRILEEARLKEEAELAEYYRNLSHTDELTGLYNHRHLVATLKQEAERHLRYNHILSLAMIDIDDFKQYNDTYGHEAGNDLIVHLANTMRQNTRNCDVLTRYGGEEFVVIFPETPLQESYNVAQRICRALELNLGITVTIGLASLPKDTLDHSDLIGLADRAMYWGKMHGKNQIVIYATDIATCK